MTDPTRLTSEDLPTLRKLSAFWSEREARLDRRGPLHRAVPRLVTRTLCRVMVLYARQCIEAVERTGHLASDERVDKHGKVGRL